MTAIVKLEILRSVGDGDAPVLEISQGIAGEETIEGSVVELNDQAGQNIEEHDGGESVRRVLR